MVSGLSLRRVARAGAGLAGVTGAYGVLSMLGAFGPVSCWTSASTSESSDGETATEVTRGCEAGIDYLFGGTGGNAPVLFFWAMVLLALVALGGVAAWTGRRRVAWATAVLGVVVSIIGVMSIGWYFVLPTLFLLVAAVTRRSSRNAATPTATSRVPSTPLRMRSRPPTFFGRPM